MGIRYKSRDDIERMRAAGRVVHDILAKCAAMCQPGVTTREIDDEAQRLIESHKVKGLFKNYPNPAGVGRPFPGTLCISVNDTVVHGIADDNPLEDGDIVSLDCGVLKDGWCGDSAVTVLVGDVRAEVRRLSEVTRHVLELAVANIKPGGRWSDVARLMQNYAERSGMGVVREFVGHGIGETMHQDPKVPNFYSPELARHDILLKPGLVMAIEPMCNLGTHEVETLADGWTVKTVDRKPSAHWEHTVAVTEDGAEVLTDGR